MKKNYIEPEITVVAINVRSNLMDQSMPTSEASADPTDSGAGDMNVTTLSRESLNTWEEW